MSKRILGDTLTSCSIAVLNLEVGLIGSTDSLQRPDDFLISKRLLTEKVRF
ncbi:hypothetical protein NOR51B_2134 [Luminiphilus syltensis NOR5-1B]|uniref:Uncharacterized protein n=1 Tax=Luminiphilus syltensis NOR5-1B TaxID=565045 RepID=B8KV81_9GAMM|nr:hypothetical protein NOR51B_2134 [Luminiphilus syltensis NOR5-1B]